MITCWLTFWYKSRQVCLEICRLWRLFSFPDRSTIDEHPIFIALSGSTKIKSTGKQISNTLDCIPLVMQAIFLIERTHFSSPIVRYSSISLTSFRLSKHGKYACAKRRSEPLSSATVRRYIVDCYGPCTQKIRLFCIFLA